MVLKITKYLVDPFKYADVFKLTCYHFTEVDGERVCFRRDLYFDNKPELYPFFEEIVLLEQKLKEWIKWKETDFATKELAGEEYKTKWNNKVDQSQLDNYATQSWVQEQLNGIETLLARI